MYKVEQKDYMNYIQYIDGSSCGAVYPYSVAEEVQHGDIFSNSHAFLYWHYSGFAFLYGKYDESFLESVSTLFLNSGGTNSRRFILFTANKSAERFFRKMENIAIESRIFFEYVKERPVLDFALPVGFRLCEINNELLEKTKGCVTPYFSWDNSTDFLKKGKGYCIVDGDSVVSWAFTAAISSEEIDIGIETVTEYQHLGLAAIVAGKMIQYCFDRHKRPVWACHADNIASGKLAEKLGFVKTSECRTIKKRLYSDLSPKNT